MKTTLETDTAHASEALQRAGFSASDRLRLEADHARPRKSWDEIISEAKREAPLKGISEMVVRHSREFRENFTVDPDRRNNPDRIPGGN